MFANLGGGGNLQIEILPHESRPEVVYVIHTEVDFAVPDNPFESVALTSNSKYVYTS